MEIWDLNNNKSTLLSKNNYQLKFKFSTIKILYRPNYQ